MAAHYANGFWESVGESGGGEDRAASVLAWLPLCRNSVVAEVGCGPGAILAAIKHRTRCTTIGVEPSESAAAVARSCVDRVIVGGWQELPDVQADVVILSHVLEHLYEPDAALQRIRAALKPTGSLYVEVPNIRAPNRRKRLSGWLTREHLWYFSPASLECVLRRNGFTVTQSRHDHAVRFLAIAGATVQPIPSERFGVWLGLARHELLYWPWYSARRIGVNF